MHRLFRIRLAVGCPLVVLTVVVMWLVLFNRTTQESEQESSVSSVSRDALTIHSPTVTDSVAEKQTNRTLDGQSDRETGRIEEEARHSGNHGVKLCANASQMESLEDAPSTRDYSEYDSQPYDGMSVQMVGIPQLGQGSTRVSFVPTAEARKQLASIESKAEEWLAQGLLSTNPQKGFIPVALEDEEPDGEIVYVDPDLAERYLSLIEQHQAIFEKHRITTHGYSVVPDVGQELPDGTKLTYYRRKDGTLIRSVRSPDGAVRKWEIGWADLSSYPKHFSEFWRED